MLNNTGKEILEFLFCLSGQSVLVGDIFENSSKSLLQSQMTAGLPKQKQNLCIITENSTIY